nr:MAG TPA: hypothetical protein [Caudoviricetes sp.]
MWLRTSEECRLIPPCMNGRAVCPNSGAVSSGTSGRSKKELGLKTRLSFFTSNCDVLIRYRFVRLVTN